MYEIDDECAVRADREEEGGRRKGPYASRSRKGGQRKGRGAVAAGVSQPAPIRRKRAFPVRNQPLVDDVPFEEGGGRAAAFSERAPCARAGH